MGTLNASAPEGLAVAGLAVWSSIVSKYELRPDELSTLEDACQLTDMIGALSSAWEAEGRPLTTKGSMGQKVTHPLISEIRTHRMARNVLWRQLKLPDVAGGEKPNQQRAAAQSRWAAAHGNSA